MLSVRLITDTLDLSDCTEHRPAALLPFLAEQFPTWPETARLYKDAVGLDNDVTPTTEEGVAALEDADGLYYVVVYPATPVMLIVASFVAVLALAAVIYVLTPPIAAIDQRNNEAPSANNALGDRQNKPRPNGRIPDIFGTVISVPELLTVPYRVFYDNRELEDAYMCIGRGSYAVSEIRDDASPVEQVPGTKVEVYAPGTSPNAGAPQIRIGSPITEPFLAAKRITSVNGQTLEPEDFATVYGSMRFVAPNRIEKVPGTGMAFDELVKEFDIVNVSAAGVVDPAAPAPTVVTKEASFSTTPGEIIFTAYDPTADFSVDDVFTVSTAPFEYYTGDVPSGGGGDVPLGAPEPGSGTTLTFSVSSRYKVASVTSTSLRVVYETGEQPGWSFLDTYFGGTSPGQPATLSNYGPDSFLDFSGGFLVYTATADSLTFYTPGSAAWATLPAFPGGATPYVGVQVTRASDTSVGPFTLDSEELTQVYVNLIAQAGLYRDDGKTQTAASVTVQVILTPMDSNDVPRGAPESYPVTLTGSALTKETIAVTHRITPTFTGRCTVEVYRTTPKDTTFKGTVVDTVKVRDVYAMTPIAVPHFGDVTTIRAVSQATTGATAQKERKLNCRVTRKVSVKNGDGTFGPALAPSQSMADILCHVALDPYIGARTIAELDVPQIYETEAAIRAYFGFAAAAQFNYTFDQDNLSYEDITRAIAQAAFCTPYRQGSKLRLFFEKLTDDSTLLFNHRNKLPASETRTVRFGILNDADGVEFDYVSPKDGAKLTLYIPSDRTATKAKKVEVIGVSDARVAHLHSSRAWNKMRFQNTTTQFDALGEATQLVLNERIEVTDDTRPDVFSGYIKSVAGLTLELSQPFDATPGIDYTLHRQLPDGGVEAIEITPTADRFRVTLKTPPSVAIVIDDDTSADVTYQIVGSNTARSSAFLLTEKGSYDKRSLQLTAINYDARYYAGDGAYR